MSERHGPVGVSSEEDLIRGVEELNYIYRLKELGLFVMEKSPR